MAKGKPDIPTDMWLRIMTDALARYVVGGGRVVVAFESGQLVVTVADVEPGDVRLSSAFAAAFAEAFAQKAAEQ